MYKEISEEEGDGPGWVGDPEWCSLSRHVMVNHCAYTVKLLQSLPQRLSLHVTFHDKHVCQEPSGSIQ